MVELSKKLTYHRCVELGWQLHHPQTGDIENEKPEIIQIHTT